MKSVFPKRNDPALAQQQTETTTPFFTKATPSQNIQAKMKTGEQQDAYEQEANDMAKSMFSHPSAPAEVAQRKQLTAPANPLETQVEQARGGGAPLPEEVKNHMEPAFQRDFSQVKVHTGPQAEALTSQANAHAFTYNNHIFYNKGQQPGVNPLTAHELTHVAQQGAPPTGRNVAENKALHGQRGTQSKATGSGSKSVTHSESPGTMRACASGSKPFTPKLGTTTTTLNGFYGTFNVEHGLQSAPVGSSFGSYFCKIEMTPNAFAVGHKIAFVQAIRRGTTAGKWSVAKDDPGMSEERAKRTTPDGWKLDRADPTADKTPFYGQTKNVGTGALTNNSMSATGEFNGTKPMLHDEPGVIDGGVMQFTSTAMDTTSGVRFGTVSWGMKYDSASSTYQEDTPALLDASDAKTKGQDDAFKKWNTDVATPGSNIDKVPGV